MSELCYLCGRPHGIPGEHHTICTDCWNEEYGPVGRVRFKGAMRHLARFMTWVVLEAEASNHWSEYDEDGNKVEQRQPYLEWRCILTPENRYWLFMDALKEAGKFRLEWP